MNSTSTFEYFSTVIVSTVTGAGGPTPTTLATLHDVITLVPTSLATAYVYPSIAFDPTTNVTVTKNMTVETSIPGYKVLQAEQGIPAAAAAGAAIGGLVVGAILAAALLLIVVRRKHNRTVQQMRENWDSEKESIQAHEYHKAQTLLYSSAPQQQVVMVPSPDDGYKEQELVVAREKIRNLEAERNAASAFGDTLDRRSEQEVLSSPQFGLTTYNQTVNQAVMALSVAVSGRGTPGTIQVATSGETGLQAIRNKGFDYARENFEVVVSHTVHTVLYEQICQPFVVGISDEHSQALLSELQRNIRASCDQGIFARWRSLTHRALRLSDGHRNVPEKAVNDILTELRVSLEDLLLWSGMESDRASALRAIAKVNSRLHNAAQMLLSLTNILSEEMASKDYQLVAAEAPQLTKSLGIIVSGGEGDEASRVLLAAKTS